MVQILEDLTLDQLSLLTFALTSYIRSNAKTLGNTDSVDFIYYNAIELVKSKELLDLVNNYRIKKVEKEEGKRPFNQTEDETISDTEWEEFKQKLGLVPTDPSLKMQCSDSLNTFGNCSNTIKTDNKE